MPPGVPIQGAIVVDSSGLHGSRRDPIEPPDGWSLRRRLRWRRESLLQQQLELILLG
jgi:hypothetical protein